MNTDQADIDSSDPKERRWNTDTSYPDGSDSLVGAAYAAINWCVKKWRSWRGGN